MKARVRTSLPPQALAALVARQLNAMFPDGDEVDKQHLVPSIQIALQRLEHCFSHVGNKYFFDGEQAIFDHLHGDQYAIWLYLLSNQLFRDAGPVATCKKLFLLNKALHGCDIFYEIELPSIFLLVHPLGTVLGRGRYADYFLVYQRCGVGSNHDIYPTLGPYTTLRPGSSVLGQCTLGRNNTLAAESLLLDRDLVDDSLYIGNPRDFVIRPATNTPSIWRN
jgi:serine O-acetyltransferase